MVNQKVAARLQVGPNCLLFFIDQTDHETFADKNYPVFGLGGCAINSSSATMSKSAVLPTGKTPLEIITGSMMNRYTDLLRRVSPEPNELAFLHEASNRLEAKPTDCGIRRSAPCALTPQAANPGRCKDRS
jgi:hypothetical protein